MDFGAAVRYYQPYGYDSEGVQRKLNEGEIHLGRPPVKEGESVVLIDDGTRYAIAEDGGAS